MITTLAQKVAREYLRVSKDKSGRLVSTLAQHRDHGRAAAGNGWTLGPVYEESGAVSASRHGRKARAGFAALMADLKSGAFAAAVLIVWEVSRGSRRTSEWLDLIDALRDAGVVLYVASEDKIYDCSKPRDRKTLREAASDSEYESDINSLRTGRGMTDEMEAGNPHGRVLRGYARTYRLDDGTDLAPGEYRLASDETKIARQHEHPETGPVIRLIYASVKAGNSLRNIDRALRGMGPREGMSAALAVAAARWQGSEAPGGPWSPTGIRDLVTNPVYAARRRYEPTYRGGHQPAVVLSDLRRGNWPALVSDEDWTAVSDIVRNPARLAAPTRSRQPKHLVSNIISCTKCGGLFTVRAKNGRPVYACKDKGCSIVTAAEVDALVTDEAIAILSDPSVYSRLVPAPDGTELALVREARDTAARELADLGAALAAGRISAMLAGAAEPAIQERLDAASTRAAELEAPAGLDVLGLAPGLDILNRWNAAPLAARRAVIRVLFASITVSPTGRGRTVPADERVAFTRR